jgi:hypothetical protein
MADAEQVKNASEKVPASTEPAGQVTLAKEVEGLEKTLTETMANREARLSSGMKIRAVVLVVVVLYFGFLYYLVAGFTADHAVMMMRGQLDAELPQIKQETVQNMKASAPQVVESYTQDLIQSVPSMRARLEGELLSATGALVNDLQAGLNEVFTQTLAESKTELDKMGPDMSTSEKLNRLSKEMRVHFHQESRAVVDELSADFSSTVRDLIKQVKHLQTSKNLTAKEKHQKEMLRVWSKLMQIKMKDVNTSFQEETQNLAR